MTVEEFFRIPTGEYIYNYGNDQCVALANLYDGGALKYDIPPGIQSAYQWWTTYSQKPQLYNNFEQVDTNPQRGDIFVSKGGVYDSVHGHIGVVERTWDGSTFGTMENGYWNGKSSMKRFNRNMNNVLGFLRPNSNVPPTPAQEDEEEMKIVRDTEGTYYLATPNGMFGISDPARLELLQRMLKSNPENPETFAPGQITFLSEYLKCDCE